LGDQSVMPRKEGVRSYDAGEAQEPFSTDGLTLDGQSAPLLIIEPRAFPQLLFEHTDFLLEVFDYNLLVPVHPTGKADQHERQGIHPENHPITGHPRRGLPRKTPFPRCTQARNHDD